MRPDQLSREVNRLYWETDGPVTRLAADLGVSRGTFYNHLEPIPATGKCARCGAPLYFRTRASRDSGAGHCEACGNEQEVTPKQSAGGGTRAERPLRIDRGEEDEATVTHESGLLAARASWLAAQDPEDRRRTQLLAIAVGAAVLGLGIMFFSRRR